MHNKMERLGEKGSMALIIALSVIVLSSPLLVRLISYDSILIGDYPFYHSRVASDILEGKIMSEDSMVVGGRMYTLNPYDFVLAFFGMFITADLASKLLPILAGISSIILFFLLLKRFRISLEIRFVTCLLVILTPAFIYGFVISNPNSIAILLILIASHLYLNNRPWHFYLSVLLSIAASLFGITSLVIILLVTASYAVYNSKDMRKLMIVNLIVITVSLLVNFFMFSFHTVPQIPFVDVTVLITDLISDLGGQISFGIFNIILAVIGIFTWGFRERPKIAYFLTLLLFFLFAFVNKLANLYLAFFISFFGALGFLALYNMRWQIKLIRDISLFIIVCGLIFSTISFTNRLVHLHPYPDEFSGLLWMKYNTPEGSLILTHQDEGFWVESIAQRQVILDPSITSIPDAASKAEDLEKIFSSRNLADTKGLLDRYGVDYIYLTKDMREKLWRSEEKGLDFLFRSNETFKNEYANSDVQVWRYKK